MNNYKRINRYVLINFSVNIYKVVVVVKDVIHVEDIKMERKEIKFEDIDKIFFGGTIHRIELYDNESTAKKCNKKMALLIRKRFPKDKRYNWYPNWSVEIEGETGEIITWSPTKKLILNFIDEFLIHEARVDMTRNRKSDTEVYKKHIQEIVLNVQNTLRKWDIPEVYKKQNEKRN